MEEVPEKPVLEIPMTQPLAKANRAETSPSPKEANAKNSNDQSDADFEAAYAADGEAETQETAEETPQKDVAEEKPANPKEAPQVEAEETDALAVFDTEEDAISDVPVTAKRAPVGLDVEADKPSPKVRAETSELAFAQRVLVEGNATPQKGMTPTGASSGVIEANAKQVSTASSTQMGSIPQGEVADKVTVQQVAGKKTEVANAAVAQTDIKQTAAATSSALSAAFTPQKSDPEVIPQRRESRERSAEDSLRAPRETASAPAPNVKSQTSAVQTTAQNTAQQATMPLTAQSDPSGLDSPISAVGEIDTPSTWDPRSASPASLAQTLSRPETPGMVGRQMAEMLQRMPDKPVELSLNPEELGRVRMSIATGEGGITVHVLAERPETLDLMRRHIDQLAREFQALGYESINFAFNEGSSDRDAGTDGDGSTSESAQTTAEDAISEPTAPITLVPSSGVDLRL